MTQVSLTKMTIKDLVVQQAKALDGQFENEEDLLETVKQINKLTKTWIKQISPYTQPKKEQNNDDFEENQDVEKVKFCLHKILIEF